MTTPSPVTRRSFLKRAALGAGAALAGPTLVRDTALGAGDRPAPSNRHVACAIGTGGMGRGDIRGLLGNKEVQFVAICDVDTAQQQRAKQMIDDQYGTGDCATYVDFRELLARRDLDIGCLALPDHWHAIPTIEAARCGLDMYGQKPLARSIREGRAMCDAVHRYGRVWQTGSWQRSVANFHHGAQLVRNGRIGKVKYVEVGLPNGGSRGPAQAADPPAGLDWDRWLGPAPWRPYCHFQGTSIHFHWRWIMDYSGGQLTDWAGHHIDIAHWGLGLDSTGPVTIEGKAVYPDDGLFNTAMAYKFTCTYADGLTMVVANASQQPHGMGACWYGENGKWIWVTRGKIEASDPNILKEEIGPDEIHLYESRNHYANFLDCVKSRKQTITPIETAHRSISVGLLGEIAMLTGRKITWDPKKETILNDPGASALLGRSYREPWHL